jgi:hypothetical protein
VLLDPVARYAKRPEYLKNVDPIKAVIYEIHERQYMYKVILDEDCWIEKLKKTTIQQKKGQLYSTGNG